MANSEQTDNSDKLYKPFNSGVKLNEPLSVYQKMDISHHEIPGNILEDIRISEREYKEGRAIPVSDFMTKIKNGL